MRIYIYLNYLKSSFAFLFFSTALAMSFSHVCAFAATATYTVGASGDGDESIIPKTNKVKKDKTASFAVKPKKGFENAKLVAGDCPAGKWKGTKYTNYEVIAGNPYSPGTADSLGNVYVSDSNNQAIRKITPDGNVTTLAGGGPDSVGSADGQGTAAQFAYPYGISVDSMANVFVADSGNNTIRKVDSNGNVTTIGGVPGTSYGNVLTNLPGVLYSPRDVAVDANDNLYIILNNSIVKMFVAH